MEGSANLRYVLDVVRSFGLEEDYVLIRPRKARASSACPGHGFSSG